MPSTTRSVLAVVAGCLAAFFHIGAIEALSHIVYPLPTGLDPSRPETIVAYLKVIPAGALLMIGLAWAVGTFAGAWLAARLAPDAKWSHGMLIGAMFLLFTAGNLASYPHPAWFWALSLATILPAAYFGSGLGARSIEPAPSPEHPPAG